MTKKHSTKRTLIASILVLCLCLTSFIGTTFAWFTDSVTSAGNIIKSGKLDVAMYWANGDEAVPADKADWTDASTGAIFKNDKWEPGYTEARHIKIANEGTLALKYQLAIIPNGEVSKLADVIDVYYADPAVQVADRTALTDSMKIGTLADVLADMSTMTGELLEGKNHTVTLVLKMQEGAGNEYQNLSIGTDFSVRLLATQMVAENDSLGNDYDDDAWAEGMAVYTASDLQAAINAGETVTLMNDIELTESIVIPAPAATGYSLRAAAPAIVINLNGKTLSGALSGAVIQNEGVAVLTGGTLANTAVNGGATINNKGTLTLSNIDVIGAPIAKESGYPSYCITNAGNLTVNAGTNVSADRGCMFLSGTGTTDINGGTFTNNDIQEKIAGRSFTSHVVVVGYGANNKLTINDASFRHLHTSTSGGVVINNWSAVTVDIKGGSFSGGNYYGKWDNLSDYGYGSTKTPFAVTGGTFTGMDNNYVADGYTAIKNADGKFDVIKGNVAAGDNAALNEALQSGEDNIALGKGDFSMPSTSGDVSISGTLDTVITVGKPTAESVNLNGVTVVGSGYSTGIQHSKAVVFENCVLVGTQCFYADEVIVRNCTIDLTEVVDYIWTYSAKKVTFDNCVFNTNGKAILIYSEGADLVTEVTVKNCTFNATASALASGHVAAAIEIDSSLATNGKYTLTTENNTVDSDFSGEWRVKKSGTNNTVVNGVIYNKVDDGLYKNESNTFYVYNANGLKWIADNVNAGDTMSGKTVSLIADIDLENKEWTTIGKNHDVEGNSPFSGTFDGNGHTVYNLYISIEDNQRDSVGFIGFAKNATIKGLTIENVYINADYFVGAIVGKLSSGSISDCHVKGDINITARRNYAAGIVGDGYYSMENCSVIANETGYIKSSAVAGGLCGRINEGAHFIKNCTVKNLDIQSSQQISAITGFVNYGNTISGCNVENVKLTLTATSAGKPAIGLASGLWYYKESSPITINNNTFKDITISAVSDATGQANILYGWEWSDNMTGVVEANNTMENITNNINYQ